MRFIYGIAGRESLTPIYNIENCVRVEERETQLVLVFFYKVVVKRFDSGRVPRVSNDKGITYDLFSIHHFQTPLQF